MDGGRLCATSLHVRTWQNNSILSKGQGGKGGGLKLGQAAKSEY